jgi:hypothetical protein
VNVHLDFTDALGDNMTLTPDGKLIAVRDARPDQLH